MQVIIDAIIGWVTSTILNRIFFKSRQNEEIVRAYERRLEKKDERIERLTRERKKREKEKHRIIESLKRSGLSTGKLVERYDKPLNAILISYVTQVEQTSSGYYRRCKFV